MRRDGLTHHAEKSRPALRSDCIVYFDAFRFLSASRLWNQVGPQPVPVSEIKAYMEVAEIEDPNEKLKYLKFVSDLDGIEVRHFYAKKAKAK